MGSAELGASHEHTHCLKWYHMRYYESTLPRWHSCLSQYNGAMLGATARTTWGAPAAALLSAHDGGGKPHNPHSPTRTPHGTLAVVDRPVSYREYRKYKPLFHAGTPSGASHRPASPVGMLGSGVTGSRPLLRAASPAHAERNAQTMGQRKLWPARDWCTRSGTRERGGGAANACGRAQDASKTRGATPGQQRDVLGCHERDVLGCHDGGCQALRTSRLCEEGPQAEDQAKAAWRTRAGAIGGGSAASCRWQRIFLIASPCVMAAMIRSDPC